MFKKIRISGTIFYSLVPNNRSLGSYGLKYLYMIISVIRKRIVGNTKKLTLVRSWTPECDSPLAPLGGLKISREPQTLRMEESWILPG